MEPQTIFHRANKPPFGSGESPIRDRAALRKHPFGNLLVAHDWMGGVTLQALFVLTDLLP